MGSEKFFEMFNKNCLKNMSPDDYTAIGTNISMDRYYTSMNIAKWLYDKKKLLVLDL